MKDRDSGTPQDHEPGVIAAARRLAAVLVDIVHTRLDLLSTEIEEESLRLRRLLLYWVLSIFFLGVGLVLFTAFIIILFWEENPLAALGIGALVYLALGAVIGFVLRQRLADKPKLFSATLGELSKDLRRLTQRP